MIGPSRLLEKSWRTRATVLLAVLFCFFGSLVIRFVQLMVFEHDKYSEKAYQNAIVVESVPAPRGRILDRTGRTLVSNQPTFDLYIVPGDLRSPELALQRVSKLVDESYKDLMAEFKDRSRNNPFEDWVLLRNLDSEMLARASRQSELNAGVYLGSRDQRRYPHGKLASHILGYMGAISDKELRELRHEGFSGREFVGKTGLEKFYDRRLRGRRGVRHRWVDSTGRTLKTEVVKSPVAGDDILLNIDVELQRETEKALATALAALRTKNGERSGAAAVVYGVKDGQIRAMASLPNFDPRPFARGIKAKEYKALLDDQNTPLVNRASHASFSPGSTFKMITGMAALDLGLCGPGSVFYCGGSYQGANCFVRSGHGRISFVDSIAHSCDVVYYSLGDQMGIGNLSQYSREAGLGKKTGIDLPGEDPGLVPDAEWKERVWEQPWYSGDTVNSSIGQGFVLTTPLQMARAVAAIAAGGELTQPRLVDRAVKSNGRHSWQNSKVISGKLQPSSAHLQTIRRGMRGAVSHGTSTVMSDLPVKVAGKTGTVESFPNPFNPNGRNHTWFVCFAPYQEPEIAVAVFFQKSGGYGGSVAAPVARSIVAKYVESRKP